MDVRLISLSKCKILKDGQVCIDIYYRDIVIAGSGDIPGIIAGPVKRSFVNK